MTHADAFLQDILAHPDDDAPRLIYADWLEEQGDAGSVARAEFIRVQCALAADQLPLQRRDEMLRREQQILGEWGKDWEHPIRRLIRYWKYHRGFIDEVTTYGDRFLAYASRLFRRAPIQHLRLLHRVRRAPFRDGDFYIDLAENEHLSRLRSLDLQSYGLESRHLRALVVSAHLTSLSALNLSHNRIGDGGIRALATSQLLGRLERLNLCFNDVGASGLRALAKALEELASTPEGLRLQRLELSYHNLSASAQRVIANSSLLRRLVR